jgi:hypothetical protein
MEPKFAFSKNFSRAESLARIAERETAERIEAGQGCGLVIMGARDGDPYLASA